MPMLRRAARYAARPSWGLAYWRGRHGAIPAEEREAAFLERAAFSGEPARALAALTGLADTDCARALARAWLPASIDGDSPVWWPREALTRLVAALVALTRPRIVIEIGVARGYTSAAILAALAGEPGGSLHSIDLPPLEEGPEFVGGAVPAELREGWELTLGPSRLILPGLLERLGPCELLVHDGDHSYDSQFEDLATAWPYMPEGGIVIVDDVWTPAVFDFADSQAARVVLARGELEHDAIAMVRKSGAAPAPLAEAS